MKRFTLIIMMFLAFTGFSVAQTIENFESIGMNKMDNGAADAISFTVVPNPVKGGINTSTNVVKMLRDKDGIPWGGFWSALGTPVDFTVNKYVHVKVYKPRISPVRFKIEGAGGNLEIASMAAQTKINEWEELVFNFSAKTGPYGTVVLMPDFADPIALTEDINIYFDDIYLNNDPAVGSAPVVKIDDFEHITLNYMGGGAEDLSKMEVVLNPDRRNVNTTYYCMKFNRDKDGVPWGGFWSALPATVDFTTNKYVHVKLWKSRISPVKFKIEGAGGNIEVASMSPQTKVNQWEELVFDFSAKTGPYGTISLMPDFEDPLTLTSDITIYFDEIVLNNVATPTIITSAPVKAFTGKVQMYPNPVRDELFINSTAELSKVVINSVLGQVVGDFEFRNNSESINISSLKRGMYIVTFVDKDGSSTSQKMIKE